MSLLDTIGNDIKGIFKWLASPTGQLVVTDTEDVLDVVYPPAAGIIQIVNTWLSEILKTQALSSAAGAATGMNAAKQTMAVNAVKSMMLVYAKNHGYPAPSQSQLEKGNDLLVAFMNNLNGK